MLSDSIQLKKMSNSWLQMDYHHIFMMNSEDLLMDSMLFVLIKFIMKYSRRVRLTMLLDFRTELPTR